MMYKDIFVYKFPFLLTVCCMACLVLGLKSVGASSGTADSYNYSYWGDAVAAPSAYQASNLLTGESLGVRELKNPSDIYVTSDQQIYVLDSGNNRIIILDQFYKTQKIIDSFQREGETDHFLNPQGIFVRDDKSIFIADTDNKRIVQLDQDFSLVQVIRSPQSDIFKKDFEFHPIRIVVDKGNRIYVMAKGVFDGFMEFSPDGKFETYIGANRVYVDPVEYFWKQLSTKKQRSQMIMFIPTEFTNLDINEDGFIYATNGDKNGNPIKKLNALGNDILRREEGHFSPQGDLMYLYANGPSRLVDVDVADSEMYSVLDAKMGRIFTYDGDGNLMFIFGGIGNRLGEFNSPIAIERVGDDFLVLDKALGEITVFQTTNYGRTLIDAVRSYYRGDEAASYQLFNKIINMNANLEYAYSGIGKSLLRQGENAEAAKFFKLGMNRKAYSKAFLRHRKEVLREHFAAIMSAMMIVLIIFLVLNRLLKRRRKAKVAIFD